MTFGIFCLLVYVGFKVWMGAIAPILRDLYNRYLNDQKQ
jgi:hypothetical protein